MKKRKWLIMTALGAITSPFLVAISCGTPDDGAANGGEIETPSEEELKKAEAAQAEKTANSVIKDLKDITFVQDFLDTSPVSLPDEITEYDIEKILHLALPDSLKKDAHVSLEDLQWEYQVDNDIENSQIHNEAVYLDPDTDKIVDKDIWLADHPDKTEKDLTLKFTWPILLSGKIKITGGEYDNYEFSFDNWVIKGFKNSELSLAEWRERFGDHHFMFNRILDMDKYNNLSTEDKNLVDSWFIPYSLWESIYKNNYSSLYPEIDWDLPYYNAGSIIFIGELKNVESLPEHFRWPNIKFDILSAATFSRAEKLNTNFYLPATTKLLLANSFLYSDLPPNFLVDHNKVFSARTFAETYLSNGFTIAQGAQIVEYINTDYPSSSDDFSEIEKWNFPENSHWEVVGENNNVITFDSLTDLMPVLEKTNEITWENESDIDHVIEYTFTETIKLIVD